MVTVLPTVFVISLLKYIGVVFETDQNCANFVYKHHMYIFEKT